jgi:tetratricopeptide (TPR) repeat protein
MILEYDPNNEEALYKVCFWTDFTGRNEESIRLHQQIIDEYPYNELAWFNLAAAYQGLRLYEKSIDAYKYALVINEKFDYAYRNMADAYIRLRKYRDAIEALEKVVELARPEDVIYEAIGHCYEKLRNPAQARFYYRKASHLNPEDARLLHRVAFTYMQESNWAQAAKYLEMALRIARNNIEYTLAMGECMMHLGREKDAIQYFSTAVQSKPRHAGAREALIRALLAGGYLEEAEKQVQLALQALHGKPVFLFYKTAVLFAGGRSREALLVMEEAMTKAPRLLKKLMDLDPALLRYQQVVDLVARFKRNKSI